MNETQTESKGPSARYKAMMGMKKANEFISRAGLGITGVYEPVIYTLDWKEGEIVDLERAQKLCQVLKDGINAFGDYECTSVELIEVCLRPS